MDDNIFGKISLRSVKWQIEHQQHLEIQIPNIFVSKMTKYKRNINAVPYNKAWAYIQGEGA